MPKRIVKDGEPLSHFPPELQASALQLQRLVDPPPQRKPRREVTLQKLIARSSKLTVYDRKLLDRAKLLEGRFVKAKRKFDAAIRKWTANGERLKKLGKRIAALEAAARGA